MTVPETAAGLEREDGVTSLELFFDLVFVLTLTQLTSLLVADQTIEGGARVALVFAVLHWMYSGYAWLTNQARPDEPARRLLLLGGMVGFFICALAIPTVFEGSGLAFGLGYLIVVGVHAGLYAERYGRAVLRFVPFNLAGALLVTLAAEASGPLRYALWLSPLALQYLASSLTRGIDESRRAGFDIRPRHFADRHAGLVIVAIGESMAAVGTTMRLLPVDVRTVSIAVLGFVLSAALWWLYFGGDDRRAEASLTAATLNERVKMALNAYFYAFIPLLLGVVVLAAGIRLSLGGLEGRLGPAPAVMLAAGVALYLVGEGAFRRALALPAFETRIAAAVVAPPAAALGVYVDGLAELCALAVLVVALVAIDASGAFAGRSDRWASASEE